MKKPLQHLLIIAAALSTSIATAQDPEPPPAGPPPNGPKRDAPPRENRLDRPAPPPADAGRRDDNRRPEGHRPPRPDDFAQPGSGGFPGENRLRPMFDERLKSGLAGPPAKPQPYLGVSTNPLDPALSAQLGFTPGLGLIVEEVMPDGPAAKAGVQALDVIKQVNDQLVSNPGHLAALARHFGKDTEVTLLVLRKGQEQKIPVKIGERLLREPAPFRPDFFGGMGLPGASRQPFERRGEAARRNNEEQDRPPRDSRDGRETQAPRPSADLLREVGPGGAPEIQSFRDRVSTTWNTAGAKVTLKDANGEIEVRSENGKRTMTAKNPKGETVFDGPIDTDDQRKTVPAEFRKMLEQVEVRSRADRRTDGPPGSAGSGRTPPEPRRGQPDVQ